MSNALNQDILLLEIVPDQSRDEAEFHLARFARISEGNPVAAEILLKGILDRSPGSNIVRLELSAIYMDQKRFDEAKDQILLAMKDTPPPDRQQIAQGGAQLLRKCGANAQADEILKAAETR